MATNETTNEYFKRMDEMYVKVDQIHTCLLGCPGTADNGLVGDVKRHNQRIARLESKTWWLALMMVGSGATGSAITKLLSL